MWNRSGMVGGFATRELTFQQTPRALVSGDGRVFSPGAQTEIYPGSMLPAVQDIEYEQPTNIADASTAQVTINVNGETFVHSADALGAIFLGDGVEESTPERQALADFIAELTDLTELVGADELGEQGLVDPSEYGIEALVVDDLASFGSDGIEPRVTGGPPTRASGSPMHRRARWYRPRKWARPWPSPTN